MPATPNYGWLYPVVGADLDTWGDILNAGGVAIDAEMFKKANANNPIFTGIVKAPAFVGDPIAILRPTVDGATAIQFQTAGGSPVATVSTLDGGIQANVFRGSTIVQLRPATDGPNAIQFQNTAGGAPASIDTSTGGMFANMFVGTAITRLFAAADGVSAIQLCNAAGTPLAVMDTLNNHFVANVFRATGAFLGSPSVAIRPTADSSTAIQFQNAAGGVVARIDTLAPSVNIPAAMNITGVFSVNGSASISGGLTIYVPSTSVGFVVVTPALSTTAGARSQAALLQANTGNADYLQTDILRKTAGSGWTNAAWRTQRVVDGAAYMTYVEHGQTRLAFGVADTEKAVLTDTGFYTTDRVVIGLNDGLVQGRLIVIGGQGTADNSQNVVTVARFAAPSGSHGAMLLDTQGVINASGYRRGFYWANGGDGFSITRYPNSGSGPMIHDINVNSGGYVGVGTTAQTYHMQVYGPGEATPSTVVNPPNNVANALSVTDSSAGFGNGGAISFGAGGSQFALIKGKFYDGTAHGLGNLGIYIRAVSGNPQMVEHTSLIHTGGIAINALPSVNPGAGTKQLWYDPADGNRIKFAA